MHNRIRIPTHFSEHVSIVMGYTAALNTYFYLHAVSKIIKFKESECGMAVGKSCGEGELGGY